MSDDSSTERRDLGVIELHGDVAVESGEAPPRPAESDHRPAPRRRILALVAAVVVVAVLATLWFVRSRPDDATGSAAPAVTSSGVAKELQLGATYVATGTAEPGAVPSCDPAAASWRSGADGSVVTTVVVPGPKVVAVVAIDAAHPERPNASHASVTIAAGKTSASVTVAAPQGGVGRVQVGIQGAEGVQQCTAPRAS